MKRARVAYAGAIHERIHAARATACGSPTAACSPKTRSCGCRRSKSAPIIALGLNYADHVKELARS